VNYIIYSEILNSKHRATRAHTSRPDEGGCAMSQLQCLPSHDLLSEIRRRVHNSRKDTSLPLFGDATADLIAHDCRIITAVLAEDFEAFVVELFENGCRLHHGLIFEVGIFRGIGLVLSPLRPRSYWKKMILCTHTRRVAITPSKFAEKLYKYLAHKVSFALFLP
jgi:hypothetical protein